MIIFDLVKLKFSELNELGSIKDYCYCNPVDSVDSPTVTYRILRQKQAKVKIYSND